MKANPILANEPFIESHLPAVQTVVLLAIILERISVPVAAAAVSGPHVAHFLTAVGFWGACDVREQKRRKKMDSIGPDSIVFPLLKKMKSALDKNT